MVSVPATLNEAIAATGNDHRHVTTAFTDRTGLDWHAPTPPQLGDGARISVVIPACNTAYSLPPVLDALAEQRTAASVEVIVVDDASTDATTGLLAAHPRIDRAVRLHARAGAGAARNVGVHLATGDTIVFLDADVVVRDHVLADIAARARQDTVLVGFRHNIPYRPDANGYPLVPPGEPDLDADHRVRWTPPAGVPMFYTGQVYPKVFVGRPLEDTREFLDLGHGRTYYDWDLPRMVVTSSSPHLGARCWRSAASPTGSGQMAGAPKTPTSALRSSATAASSSRCGKPEAGTSTHPIPPPCGKPSSLV